MTKKAYRKMVIGHLQWSVIGLVIALVVAFVNSDYRSVVYGVPATEFSVSEVPAALPSTAFTTESGLTSVSPASGPKESAKLVIPDTINGALVWPDPWDDIKSSSGVNY